MQMNDFEQGLLVQAAQEMWFDPHDDRHVTLVPVRFNRLRGSRARINLGYTDHFLPDSTTPYVVYGVGQVSTALLGFEETRLELLEWIRLDRLARDNELVINAHIQQRMLPLSTIYVRRNERLQLTFAVDARANESLLQTEEPLLIRLFSNDWIQERLQVMANPVEEMSVIVERDEDAGPIISRWRQSESGTKMLFHNGYYVNDITSKELNSGDSLALAIDKSGLGYIDFPLNDLPHYFSKRDSRGKWLIQLNLPDAEQPVPVDEVDIYVVAKQLNQGDYVRVKGFYYSRINDEDIRQITHQDFAVDSRRLEALITEHQAHLEMGEPFLRVFLRQTTERKKRYPQVDGSHTLDLYRVDVEERTSLMVGAGSTYQPWNASELEKAPYALWQHRTTDHLNAESLWGVYSWAEVNRRVLEGRYPAERVIPDAVTGHKHYRLPYVATAGCMVLGYDAKGQLVHRVSAPPHSHNQYVLIPGVVETVRCLPGDGKAKGKDLDRDTDFIDQADWFAERLYWRAVDDETWHVGIEGTDYVTDRETGRRVWTEDHENDGRMRRSVRDSVYRDLTVQIETLHHPIPLFEADDLPYSLLPLCHTEVYFNGRYLVEGVDFEVQYPNIQLHTKAYHLEGTPNIARLEIFHYGLPDDTHRWQEHGFVRNRRMTDGNGDRFSEYRYHTLVVDGELSVLDHWDLVERPEQTMADSIREGALYYRSTAVAALSEWASDRLGLKRDHDLEAMAVTSRFLERPVPDGPVFIPYAHAIFSPFVYRTVQRVRSKEIDVSKIGLSLGGVTTAMTPYLEELDQDILSRDLDWKLIDVHPAPANEQMEITEDEFLFLRLLNERYFHNRLVFNTYFNVTRNLS